MPILSQEPMIYPEGLLDGNGDGTPVLCPDVYPPDAHWFVAHTRPRQEKALARHLFARGVPYFLPQYTRHRVDRSGPTTSWIPLFAGYLFVKTDESGRIEALQSNRIVAPLRVIDEQKLVNDLRRVKRLIDSQLPLYPEERLLPGRPVRIVHGPLAGMEGVVEARLGRTRFVVMVDFIRQGVSAEVDASALEPLADLTPRPITRRPWISERAGVCGAI